LGRVDARPPIGGGSICFETRRSAVALAATGCLAGALAAQGLPPRKNLDDPAVAFAHFGDCQQWIQVERRRRPIPPGWDDLILDINIIKARRYLPKERPRSAGGRDLVDEISDVSFDFVA
jgi:hypothetical protein